MGRNILRRIAMVFLVLFLTTFFTAMLTSLVRGEPLRNVVGAGDAVTADGKAVRAT